MQLSKNQAAMLEFMFDALPISGSVNTLDFVLSGAFTGRFHAVHAPMSGAEDASIVFTLPTYTPHVLIGLTRARQSEVARILANVEDYERENRSQLRAGDVVVLPNGDRAGAPFAIDLLRTASSLDLSDVPDRATIAGREIEFSLAVPLTKREWEYRSQHGHDALLDLFQSENKQLFFF